MSNKMKMFLGIAFVFVQLAAVSLFSIYYAYNIANQTKTLFTDNILTLQYCEKMSEAVERLNNYHLSLLTGKSYSATDFGESTNVFEDNLVNEENNITEPGEKERVDQLKSRYSDYQKYLTYEGSGKISLAEYSSKILPLYNGIKSDIHSIADINLQPIQRKKDQALEYENHFYLVLSILATICLLVSFSFLFNFPKIVKEME